MGKETKGTKGKKEGKGEVAVDLEQFTAEERTVVEGFNPDELALFAKMDLAGQKEHLSVMAELAADAVNEKLTTIETEDVSTTGDDDFKDDVTILRPGGPGLSKGTVLRAQFLGTVPMWSDKKIPNWTKEVLPGDKEVYTNFYYKFRTTSGREFGVYKSPMLGLLRRVPTHTATPGLVAKDPYVEIAYFGKIESAERLLEEFDFQLTTGSSAHAFKLRLEKDVKFDRYKKGVVNYLKNPYPSFEEANTKENLSDVELKMKSWQTTEKLNGAATVNQVEHSNASAVQ